MKKWILLVLMGFSSIAFAQKAFLERTFEGRSKEKNPLAARQDILNQALEKTSEELIKEIIGEAKYDLKDGRISFAQQRQIATKSIHQRPRNGKA